LWVHFLVNISWDFQDKYIKYCNKRQKGPNIFNIVLIFAIFEERFTLKPASRV